MTQSIAASEFKATCLAVLDVVAESAEEFVITKHGRPVARLVPILPEGRSFLGSVTYASLDDVMASTGERWEAAE
jgi:prevent-host-death family protein